MLKRKQLHKYQVDMVGYITDRQAAGLFLDIGLGKTIITLTVIADLLDDFAVNKVLIVAPIRVCTSVWIQEAAKWAHTRHLKVVDCTGAWKHRLAMLSSDADVYLINPENVPHMQTIFNTQRRWKWDMVTLDESHHFKNPSSKRFRALRKMLPAISHRLILTGTPSANSVADLWSQVFFLDQGTRLFRTIGQFRGMWMKPAGFQGRGYAPREGATEAIREKIADLCVSMTASDYLTLPDTITVNRMVTIPAKVQAQCDELQNELIAIFNGKEIEAGTAAAVGIKLRQLMNGAVYNEDKEVVKVHDEKIASLIDLLEDQSNERFILCYQFKHDVERIRAAIPYARVMDKKGDEIDRWNRKETRLLLIHPASAGAGLNLQHGGHNMIWFGLDFNLGNYIQTCGRLSRQGQLKPVTITHLLAEGTTEQKIAAALRHKAATQRELMEYLKHENKS